MTVAALAAMAARDPADPADPAERAARLRELAALFVRLGLTAFGGPAAHIAMLEDEVVRRRSWLTRGEFLDLLAATNLIPGPTSTEMAIHIGHRQAGALGLLVAGVSFITPASLVTLALAWAYVRYGMVPEGQALLYGVKPVVIAIVAQALWGLGRSVVRSTSLCALALAALAASFAGVDELALLLACGVAAALARSLRGGVAVAAVPFGLVPWLGAAAVPFTLLGLFLFFLKVGSVLFGSGYVLLAFLRADLVDRWKWLTDRQLLDAVAVGQLTPGPVSTTATFIGYVLGGFPGALLATLGIFLPAFVFAAASGPIVPRLRHSPAAGAFLDGVIVASLALMAAVTVALARAAIVDLPSAAVFGLSAWSLTRLRVNSFWLVLGGGLTGLLVLHGRA